MIAVFVEITGFLDPNVHIRQIEAWIDLHGKGAANFLFTLEDEEQIAML